MCCANQLSRLIKCFSNAMLLLTPGPVNVPKEVLDQAGRANIFHRSSDFEQLFQNCTEKIKTILGADAQYASLLLGGSGTLAIEAFVQSVLSSSEDVTVISNGHFGDRIAEMVEIGHGKPRVIRFDYGTPVSLDAVEAEIKKTRPSWLLLVAHETSSGMINPVDDIGSLCREYRIKFMVDAVSALGGMDINVVRQSIDACVSVPNKGLEGLPGVSFICVKRELVDKPSSPKTFCLNLHRYYDFSLKNQMPNTPSTPSILGLTLTLDLYLEEGLVRRKKRYQALSHVVLEHAKQLDLKLLILEGDQRFPALTTIVLPDHISARELHRYLFHRGMVIWFYDPSLETSNRNLFQISVMGDIKGSDIRRCFGYIREFLEQYD